MSSVRGSKAIADQKEMRRRDACEKAQKFEENFRQRLYYSNISVHSTGAGHIEHFDRFYQDVLKVFHSEVDDPHTFVFEMSNAGWFYKPEQKGTSHAASENTFRRSFILVSYLICPPSEKELKALLAYRLAIDICQNEDTYLSYWLRREMYHLNSHAIFLDEVLDLLNIAKTDGFPEIQEVAKAKLKRHQDKIAHERALFFEPESLPVASKCCNEYYKKAVAELAADASIVADKRIEIGNLFFKKFLFYREATKLYGFSDEEKELADVLLTAASENGSLEAKALLAAQHATTSFCQDKKDVYLDTILAYLKAHSEDDSFFTKYLSSRGFKLFLLERVERLPEEEKQELLSCVNQLHQGPKEKILQEFLTVEPFADDSDDEEILTEEQRDCEKLMRRLQEQPDFTPDDKALLGEMYFRKFLEYRPLKAFSPGLCPADGDDTTDFYPYLDLGNACLDVALACDLPIAKVFLAVKKYIATDKIYNIRRVAPADSRNWTEFVAQPNVLYKEKEKEYLDTFITFMRDRKLSDPNQKKINEVLQDDKIWPSRVNLLDSKLAQNKKKKSSIVSAAERLKSGVVMRLIETISPAAISVLLADPNNALVDWLKGSKKPKFTLWGKLTSFQRLVHAAKGSVVLQPALRDRPSVAQ
jgi:hypothetical protein